MNRRGSGIEDRVLAGKTTLDPRSSILYLQPFPLYSLPRSLKKRQPLSKKINRHSEIWTELAWFNWD